MSKILLRRYLLFCVSLFVNALGIAFITKAALGTSPITSVTIPLLPVPYIRFSTTGKCDNRLYGL